MIGAFTESKPSEFERFHFPFLGGMKKPKSDSIDLKAVLTSQDLTGQGRLLSVIVLNVTFQFKMKTIQNHRHWDTTCSNFCFNASGWCEMAIQRSGKKKHIT